MLDRLLLYKNNTYESRVHLYDRKDSQKQIWRSVCGEAFDDLQSKNGDLFFDVNSEQGLLAQEHVTIPPLCEKCKLIETMMELSE